MADVDQAVARRAIWSAALQIHFSSSFEATSTRSDGDNPGYGPALGKRPKVNDVWLEVIGLLASDPAGAPPSRNGVPAASNAEEIWLPVPTAMRKFDRDPTRFSSR